MSSLSLFLPGDDIPELCDLHKYIVPQYAARWEALGAFLGLKSYEIDVISKDYANRSADGCAVMLRKWLQKVDQPTWGKLDDAINLLKPSSTSAVTNYIANSLTNPPNQATEGCWAVLIRWLRHRINVINFLTPNPNGAVTDDRGRPCQNTRVHDILHSSL